MPPAKALPAWSTVCEELVRRLHCVLVVDAEGTIVFANDARGLLDRKHLIGTAVEECLPCAPTELRAAIVRAIEQDAVEQLAFSHSGGDTTRSYVAHLMRLDSLPALIAIQVQDETIHKHSEFALQNAIRELEETRHKTVQAQRMELMGRLAGGVAHDFNNLLTAIISFSRFVMDDLAPSDPRRADLGEVLKAADSASKLTSQLQAFSRGREVEPVLVEFNASIRRISRVLRRTLSESIDLQIVEANEPVHVMFDPGQFDQLVMNLTINARDAMPDGGKLTLTIGRQRVEGHSELASGNYASLIVSDTGCGIGSDAIDQIFEPFFTTKGEKGTGLGLATCYWIVKQASGDINVQSEPGQGSRFTALLPLANAAQGTALVQHSMAPPQVKLKGLALVVEDHAAIRRTMSRSLQNAGLSVLETGSAEEAIEVVDQLQARLDLLVTDVILPGVNGVKLMEVLRERQPGLPVVICSGFMGEARETGVTLDDQTAFLPKPFTGPQLLAKATTLLHRIPLT